jgi:hypothetical protein
MLVQQTEKLPVAAATTLHRPEDLREATIRLEIRREKEPLEIPQAKGVMKQAMTNQT